VVVFPGQTRDVEFVADAPGDWALHCHRRHHPMNAMDHDFPNLLGVSQAGLERDIQAQLPGYMAMGETGMHEHALHGAHMQGPSNTLPMMAGVGQFGPIGMGGMFTVLKVREDLRGHDDPGWYAHPGGTVAGPAAGASTGPAAGSGPAADHGAYVCPMHPHVRADEPGRCPECGMSLVPVDRQDGRPEPVTR
jgi:hypothetical protein